MKKGMISATTAKSLVISEMIAPTPQQENTMMIKEDKEEIGEKGREPLLPKLKKATRRHALKELTHPTSVAPTLTHQIQTMRH